MGSERGETGYGREACGNQVGMGNWACGSVPGMRQGMHDSRPCTGTDMETFGHYAVRDLDTGASATQPMPGARSKNDIRAMGGTGIEIHSDVRAVCVGRDSGLPQPEPGLRIAGVGLGCGATDHGSRGQAGFKTPGTRRVGACGD